ncbi:MAG: serine/threonine protein kinase [Muribaculum sp.]|nr:serine/threonine protein kinase [Muribaculaceae bacterium]MCM1081430.1 serine/threonine protein kinase [Muribaculum sp.]
MDQIASSALPPKTIIKGNSKYMVEKVLGAGGFGITYRVVTYHGNIAVRFAVKEYFPSNMCERVNGRLSYSGPVKNDVENGLASFIAEAERLKAQNIHHPNIVGINEVIRTNNTAYYVMEYITGRNVRDYLMQERGRTPLPEDEALDLIRPVLSAINMLHNHKITHLDIKPDNIVLAPVEDSDKLRPVVIDFGLSKHYDEKGNATSKVKFIACSPGYAPNEQYQDSGISTFTPQADVYALGATLFFMLTGKDPAVAANISRDKVLAALPSNVSEKTRNAIADAMRPDKSERTQSVAQLASNLGITLNNSSDSNLTVPISLGDKSSVIDKVTNNIGKIGKISAIGAVAAVVIVLAVTALNTGFKEKPSVGDTLQLTQQPPVSTDSVVEQPQQQPLQQPQQPEPQPQQTVQQQVQPQAPAQPQPQTPAQPAVTSGQVSLGYGTYNGQLRSGKPDGKGTITFSRAYSYRDADVEAGYRIEGTFENGQLVVGKLYDNNGTLLQTIM